MKKQDIAEEAYEAGRRDGIAEGKDAAYQELLEDDFDRTSEWFVSGLLPEGDWSEDRLQSVFWRLLSGESGEVQDPNDFVFLHGILGYLNCGEEDAERQKILCKRLFKNCPEDFGQSFWSDVAISCGSASDCGLDYELMLKVYFNINLPEELRFVARIFSPSSDLDDKLVDEARYAEFLNNLVESNATVRLWERLVYDSLAPLSVLEVIYNLRDTDTYEPLLRNKNSSPELKKRVVRDFYALMENDGSTLYELGDRAREMGICISGLDWFGGGAKKLHEWMKENDDPFVAAESAKWSRFYNFTELPGAGEDPY